MALSQVREASGPRRPRSAGFATGPIQSMYERDAMTEKESPELQTGWCRVGMCWRKLRFEQDSGLSHGVSSCEIAEDDKDVRKTDLGQRRGSVDGTPFLLMSLRPNSRHWWTRRAHSKSQADSSDLGYPRVTRHRGVCVRPCIRSGILSLLDSSHKAIESGRAQIATLRMDAALMLYCSRGCMSSCHVAAA